MVTPMHGTPRLANARDLRIDFSTSPASLVPIMNSYQRESDDGQTVQTLRGMGWPEAKAGPNANAWAGASTSVYGSVGIPDDAAAFVSAYLDAGTGNEAISTRMPLLIWLVFMGYCDSRRLLESLSRTMRGSGAMQGMFANDWCRQILLEKMPELTPAREADEGPNLTITLDNYNGFDASDFVCACMHGRVMNKEIDKLTLSAGYNTLPELLRRWKGSDTHAGWDQLVRDTLFQLYSNWGKKMQEGGVVNRRFAEKLFRAMGGLGP